MKLWLASVRNNKLQVCRGRLIILLTPACREPFHDVLSSADFFFYRNIRVSNSFDPDQAWHFSCPDLGPNICKGYQQTTLLGKVLTLLHAGNLFMIFCHQLIFFKIEFSIVIFTEIYIRCQTFSILIRPNFCWV